MRGRARARSALLFVAALVAAPAAWAADPASRIVSIGGSVTEIVFALGEGDRLVARDTTSSFPQTAAALPDVGYMRRLSAEGILSVDPDLILAEAGSGPPETIAQLSEAQIPFVTVPDGFDSAGVVAKIGAVADALGVPDKGAALAARVDDELRAVAAPAAGRADKKRVMFILSNQGGRILASGGGTAADAIIGMAGAVNVFDTFDGYKPVSDEAITLAAPDVILMMERGGDHNLDDATLFAHPAISTTPAAADAALVRMNGLLLLGFGPRIAQSVQALGTALYGAEG